MTFQGVLSVAMLAAFIWTVRFMVPKAAHRGDALALTSAILSAVLALVGWLVAGVRVTGVACWLLAPR
jgi:hypothetical protein